MQLPCNWVYKFKFSVPRVGRFGISRNNSIKNVGNGVSCLVFIDGGLQMEEAMVMGTFQMEYNFLLWEIKS